jgi:hypothetical protein
MSVLERSRLRALAIKIESTSGTDAIAGTPAAGDWVDAEFNISPDFVVSPDPSFTGSLDNRPGIVGGGRFTISGVRVPLRGAGQAVVAPEWFRVLQAAGMVITATDTPVGGPTAATAGTTTTATLAAPFAATADLYKFMPITLSGNPATPRTTLITDYTAGRVATFSRTFSTLTTSTLAIIPTHRLLEFTDTEADFRTLTVYAYQAGQLFIGTHCVALNPRIELTVGQPGFLVFDLLGVLADASPAETALPAGAAAVTRPTPPTWRGGEAQIGRAEARCQRVTFSLGAAGILSPAPESANGFDGAHLMARTPRCEIEMMSNSTASPARVSAMRAGTDTLFSAILGTSAGNRLGFIFSPGRIVSIRTGSNEGADSDQITLEPSLAGGSFGVASF